MGLHLRIGVVLTLFGLSIIGEAVSDKHVVMYYRYPVRVDIDTRSNTAMVTPPLFTGKTRTFYDYNKNMVAYKDFASSQCYLERIAKAGGMKQRMRQIKSTNQMMDVPRTLYVSNMNITKYEVWKLAGSQIAGFCRGFRVSLLQEFRPQYQPEYREENQLTPEPSQKMRGVLQPTQPFQEKHLRSRSKRQATTSHNTRSASRRFRGQTQTQYISFQNGGGTPNGGAEAISQTDLSSAKVSK